MNPSPPIDTNTSDSTAEGSTPVARRHPQGFTPGPWKACPSVENDFLGVYPDTGRGEFPIAKMPEIIRPEINEANARLIAAAPDLLAALQAAVGLIETLPEDAFGYNHEGADHQWRSWPLRDEHLHHMRAALAKALPADGREAATRSPSPAPLSEHLIPEGWKLVPIEITGPMWSAGRHAFATKALAFEAAKTTEERYALVEDQAAAAIWAAMLAVSPLPSMGLSSDRAEAPTTPALRAPEGGG